MTVSSGISKELIVRLKDDIKFDECSQQQKIVGIMMDEIKIKSGLLFYLAKRLENLLDLQIWEMLPETLRLFTLQ